MQRKPDPDLIARGLALVASGDLKCNEYGSYTCVCKKTVMVRRVKKNGVVTVGHQCVICCAVRQVPKNTVRNVDTLPPCDETTRIWDVTAALSAQDRLEQDSEKNREWWRRYNAYLATPQWRSRRNRVMRRAGGTCEACLEQPATEVHHTTYEHVCNEPLWELRAVCHECHEQITDMDRRNRGIAT
jgi:hypothetical protein